MAMVKVCGCGRLAAGCCVRDGERAISSFERALPSLTFHPLSYNIHLSGKMNTISAASFTAARHSPLSAYLDIVRLDIDILYFTPSASAPPPRLIILISSNRWHRAVFTMAETNNLKQRRGKKSSPPPEASASTTSEVNASQPPAAPLEQLRSAEERLIVARERTVDLHAAWRGQLFRLSLLVVFVAMYQLQTSIAACIREIKDHDTKAATVTGVEAMQLIFGDSFSELLGVIISSLLAYFLAISSSSTSAQADLNAWPYMVSSALTPVCLGFFFNSRSMGCLGEEETLKISDTVDDDRRHQFPAVVIYHTIVTFAFWFMKSGMQQCEDNVKLCTQSIQDIEKMSKTTRSKSTNGGKKK